MARTAEDWKDMYYVQQAEHTVERGILTQERDAARAHVEEVRKSWNERLTNVERERDAALAKLALSQGVAWIPVSERLPEEGVPVLGAFKGQFDWMIFRAYNFSGAVNAAGYADATHWMPLPEPPKEGK